MRILERPEPCVPVAERARRDERPPAPRFLAERSHAFLALPGGIGTFEELFEVWTWRQLGYHDKPIGILNVAGYYDSMLQFLLGTVQSEFMGEWQMELVRSGEHIPQLLAHLIEAAGTSPESQALEENI